MNNVDRTSDLSLNQSIKERFEELIKDGKQVEATSPLVDVNVRPAYLFDENRFHRAQRICQGYYSNISFASTTGLILLVQLESILVPLLKTGKSRTIPDLLDRYLATSKYIRICYETKFFDRTSEGWKSINLVRSMHKRIHQIMKEEPYNLAEKHQQQNVVWVNQYDMAITQFAFIGLFLLRPDKCGAYHVTKEELSDITYYWRVISYYFGIEERFNIFVYHDDLDKQIRYMNLIFGHINGLLAETRREVGVRMAEGIIQAFEDFSIETSFNVYDHWWFPYVSISGLNPPKPYTWLERFKLIIFLFYFKILMSSETLRLFVNELYKKKYDKFCAAKDEIIQKLSVRHKNVKPFE